MGEWMEESGIWVSILYRPDKIFATVVQSYANYWLNLESEILSQY